MEAFSRRYFRLVASREQSSEDEAEDREASEEESEEDKEEDGTALSPRSSEGVAPKNLERLPPVDDTPWGEFACGFARLGLWLIGFAAVQVAWCTRMKKHVNLAFLPVSWVLVPLAFRYLRDSRQVGCRYTEGLEVILEWLIQGNQWLNSFCTGQDTFQDEDVEKVTLRRRVEKCERRDQRRHSGAQGGIHYKVGLFLSIHFMWMMFVGQNCWPLGYLYLVRYAYERCRDICALAENGTISHGHGFQLVLQGNGTQAQARSTILAECEEGMDPVRSYEPGPLTWTDPHWLIKPEGAWVRGWPPLGDVRYNMSHVGMERPPLSDCTRITYNVVVIVSCGLLALMAGSIIFLFNPVHGIMTAGAIFLSFSCITGIAAVWLHWARCRTSTISSSSLVFADLIYECRTEMQLSVTRFAAHMRETHRKFLAFESDLRNSHQVARSEVWIGGTTTTLALLLVIMAHSTFRHKRMQAVEARCELIRRRPRLVRCLLENCEFIRLLPSRDQITMVRNLHRVFTEDKKQKQEKRRFEGLKDYYEKMMELEANKPDLSAIGSSFWPAAVFSLVRCMLPSIQRQFIPLGGYVNAVPMDNSLWMLSFLQVAVLNFLAYVFILFQIREAARRYMRNMQVWIAFDSLWIFPSQNSLAGDPMAETVELDADGEGVAMLSRAHKPLADFGLEHQRDSDDFLVNLDQVREMLPTWWAWREYLIIDYVDKRVRLELHIVVALIVVLVSFGLVTVDAFFNWKDRPTDMDAERMAQWYSEHLNAITMQVFLDLLFFTPPLLTAMSCACAMNKLIETQLHKVEVLEALVCQHVRGTADERESNLVQLVGHQVRNVFRVARSELQAGGRSATRILSLVKINRQTLAIVGTLLSLCTGSQCVELFNTFSGIFLGS